MNEREEYNRLECCERCGEPPALCGCWSTDNDLVGRLRRQLAEARAEVERLHQEFEKSSQRHLEADRSTEEYCEHLREKLAAQAAEIERLRERCEEFATTLIDAVAEIREDRDHWKRYHEKTEGMLSGAKYHAIDAALNSLENTVAIAQGWLPDSNNKGATL